MRSAVILAIGREILRGRIQDTNSWTIGRRLTGLGYAVIRMVACDDDRDAILREIRRATEDGACLVISTGGLGPTDDDLTLTALAAATGRPLTLDQEARRMVSARYAELHRSGALDSPVMTPSREKMARIPQEARPLPNPVGAAPGVWLEGDETTYVALPGVPAEMVAILETSVLPWLASRATGSAYLEHRIATLARDESELAPVLRQIMRELPEVFLKSHATHFGSDVRMEVFASTWTTDRAQGEQLLGQAAQRVRERLGEAPGPAA